MIFLRSSVRRPLTRVSRVGGKIAGNSSSDPMAKRETVGARDAVDGQTPFSKADDIRDGIGGFWCPHAHAPFPSTQHIYRHTRAYRGHRKRARSP